MSSMSTGPGDQVNVNRDDYYESGRGNAWRWLLPLLALAIVAALLWAMFGTRGATYPTTAGNGTTISTPAGGTSYGGTTGTNPSGSGMAGSGAAGSSGTGASGAGTSGTTGSTGAGTSGTTGSTGAGTYGGAAAKP